MSLLAIEPGIPASRICNVIGFDKGPVSRNAVGAAEARPGRDPDRAGRRPHPSISLTARGRAIHDRVIVAALERNGGCCRA